MKIEGTDIKKINTWYLLKNCRVYSFLIPFYFVFAAFFGVPTVALGFLMDPRDLADMWVIIPLGLIAAVVFTYVGIKLIKKVKGIRAELDTRKISKEEREEAERIVKKIFKGSMVILAASIVIILLAFGGSVAKNIANSSDSSEKCRNCGRKKDLVAGFDYCYDCYEGFADWQDRTWTED